MEGVRKVLWSTNYPNISYAERQLFRIDYFSVLLRDCLLKCIILFFGILCNREGFLVILK